MSAGLRRVAVAQRVACYSSLYTKCRRYIALDTVVYLAVLRSDRRLWRVMSGITCTDVNLRVPRFSVCRRNAPRPHEGLQAT